MNQHFFTLIRVTSLTIFAMLFGAGNLIFPIALGLEAGTQTPLALTGFLLTGVALPLLGLLAIVAFEGNYHTFFGRLGKIPGFLATLYCMMVIGPFVVMPRIVTLSYEMLQPFLPAMPVLVFSTLFLALVFVATYRPSKLVDLIGRFLSPLKIGSIVAIVLIGLFNITEKASAPILDRAWFSHGLALGYGTLDLLGAIFFGSIIISLLTRYARGNEKLSTPMAVKVTGIAGIFAALILAGVYIGMAMLGEYYGAGLEGLNPGKVFSEISFRVVGTCGAALIGLTVFLACFTTAVSLSAVVADFVCVRLFDNKISYTNGLLTVLGITALIARHGLGAILAFSMPFIEATYPIFITITVCNIAYKLFGFRAIKIPTLITALIILMHYVR